MSDRSVFRFVCCGEVYFFGFVDGGGGCVFCLVGRWWWGSFGWVVD